MPMVFLALRILSGFRILDVLRASRYLVRTFTLLGESPKRICMRVYNSLARLQMCVMLSSLCIYFITLSSSTCSMHGDNSVVYVYSCVTGNSVISSIKTRSRCSSISVELLSCCP